MIKEDIINNLNSMHIDTHLVRKYAELKDKVINIENQLKRMADYPDIYSTSGIPKILYHNCLSDDNLNCLEDMESAIKSFSEQMHLIKHENKYENIEFMKISRQIDFGNIDYTGLMHYFPSDSEYVIFDTDYDYGDPIVTGKQI